MPVSQKFHFLQVFLFLGLYDVTESGRPGAEAPPTSHVCVSLHLKSLGSCFTLHLWHIQRHLLQKEAHEQLGQLICSTEYPKLASPSSSSQGDQGGICCAHFQKDMFTWSQRSFGEIRWFVFLILFKPSSLRLKDKNRGVGGARAGCG